jgi:hypothetical protein
MWRRIEAPSPAPSPAPPLTDDHAAPAPSFWERAREAREAATRMADSVKAKAEQLDEEYKLTDKAAAAGASVKASISERATAAEASVKGYIAQERERRRTVESATQSQQEEEAQLDASLLEVHAQVQQQQTTSAATQHLGPEPEPEPEAPSVLGRGIGALRQRVGKAFVELGESVSSSGGGAAAEHKKGEAAAGGAAPSPGGVGAEALPTVSAVAVPVPAAAAPVVVAVDTVVLHAVPAEVPAVSGGTSAPPALAATASAPPPYAGAEQPPPAYAPQARDRDPPGVVTVRIQRHAAGFGLTIDEAVRKTALIEVPCSPLISVCQRFGHPRRLNRRRFWQGRIVDAIPELRRAGVPLGSRVVSVDGRPTAGRQGVLGALRGVAVGQCAVFELAAPSVWGGAAAAAAAAGTLSAAAPSSAATLEV